MDLKKGLKIAGIAVLIALIGYAFGRYAQPAKIVEKEKIKVVTQVVEVVKEVKVENKDVDTKTTVTEKPDGTKVTTTETTDKTKISTNTDTNKNTNEVATIDKMKITTFKKPDWQLTAFAGVNAKDWRTSPVVYGGSVQKRLIGPFFVGAFGMSNGTCGGVVTLEF